MVLNTVDFVDDDEQLRCINDLIYRRPWQKKKNVASPETVTLLMHVLLSRGCTLEGTAVLTASIPALFPDNG